MGLSDIQGALADLYASLNGKIPHFPYIFAAALVLVLGIFAFFIFTAGPASAEVKVLVQNAAGAAVKGAQIAVTGTGTDLNILTGLDGAATFSAPIGAQITVTASKQGYAIAKESITVSQGAQVTLVLRQEQFTINEVTLTFTGPDSRKLSGTEVNVRLSCSGTGVFEKSDYTVSEGEIKLRPPQNCGKVLVRATAAGFQTASAQVLGTNQEILFHGIERPKGSVEINVAAADTNRFVDGINVKLVDSVGLPAGFEDQTSFGEASFAGVDIGTYTALISDPTGQYASESVALTVHENAAATRSVRISKDIKLKAKIKVIESGGAAIEGAEVAIYGADGILVGMQVTGTTDGSTVFLLKDDGIFYYSAGKQGFMPSDRNSFATFGYTKASQQEFTVRLGRCTEQTCGSLLVRVLDENGSPVENARAMIVNADGFVETVYGSKVTDYNGFAAPFTGIEKGTYTVLAQKFPAEAKSAPFELDPGAANSVAVNMRIGSGTVKVSALDEDAKPLSFAKADIFTDSGAKIGTISLDSAGIGTLSVKADRRVYAVITKEGYAPYVAASKQVYPDIAIQFTGSLEREISSIKPSIEFIGVFSQGGTRALSLAAGGAYIAKFLLRIPSQQEFSASGVFIRVGEKDDAERDSISISSVNAPRAGVVKGATYRPSGGTAGEEQTNGNAKWAEIIWNGIGEGKYEIEAEVKVKGGTTKGTPLPIFYRAFGVDGAKYLRDPIDSALGENEDSEQKKGIYAQSYSKEYLEGITEQCSGEFCFTTRLLDNIAGVYMQEPYRIKTFSPYTLEFSLTNNSAARHESASISIRDTRDMEGAAKEISISSYSIENADSAVFNGSAAVFETPQIAMGDFAQNKAVSGTLGIEAKTLTSSALEFKVISSQNIAFDRVVAFIPVFQDDINLEVNPAVIAAFVPADINVTATYAGGENKGFGIAGARVIVKKIAPDRSEFTFPTAVTNTNGLTKISIPASSPGTKIIVKAEKAGLGVVFVERTVSTQVVAFDPLQLKPALNRATNEEVRTKLTASNLVDSELTIKKIVFSAGLDGLLDSAKMNNFLVQYAGAKIPKSGSKDLEVLSAIGEGARSLDAPAKSGGKIIAELSPSANPAVSYLAQLPYEAMVNLAEMPSNSPCISISAKEWKDATIDSKAAMQFEIENNCVSKQGAKIGLNNLQGRIRWAGKDGIAGLVELSVTDPVSGTVASEILQQGLYVRLLEGLTPGIPYPATLTFVPKQGAMGKRAEFTVDIDAQIGTNKGEQFVGANNGIDAQVTVANLGQCMQITPDPELGVHIGRRDSESEFTVDTTKCGPAVLDIRFCDGGTDGCRGGASEGGISLRPWSYSKVSGEQKSVVVERQGMPGFYGIKVEARPLGGSWRQVAEIAAIVEPEDGLYFTMDKYSFTVIGKGSSDFAKLTNDMVQEKIEVRKLKTGPLYDYVINLSGSPDGNRLNPRYVWPDATEIVVSDPRIRGDWNLDIADEFTTKGEHASQQVGITFGNISAEQDRPVFAVVTAKAKEHVHGDPLHREAKVKCGGNNFGLYTGSRSDYGMYWINPGVCGNEAETVYDTVYSQKFHVKFKVSEEKADVPDLSFDSFACQSGVEIGRTGAGALPKVKFEWAWREIPENQCDASNPDYVYCDAAQFTIELNKKLHRLYEFLQANNFNLGCPSVSTTQNLQQSLSQETESAQVLQGQAGLLEVKTVYFQGNITSTIKARNATDSEQDIVATAVITNLSGFEQTCIAEILGVPAGGEKMGACETPISEDGIYSTVISAESETAGENISMETITTGIYAGTIATAEEQMNRCDLKATQVHYQVPQILRFVEGKSSITWTSAVPNKEALANMLVFDAYLMRDNYPKEFFRDFSETYTNNAFADTESYFTSIGSGYGFNRLLQNGNFSLGGKYSATEGIPSAGRYGVELAVQFSGNDWKFFDSQGRPLANVKAIVYRKSDPSPNSPFYSLPIDGFVGLVGNTYRRTNYGTAFSNDSEPVQISLGNQPVKTYPSEGGSAAIAADVKLEEGIYGLNTAPGTGGMILSAESIPGKKAGIVLQPSHATPVLMKVSRGELASEKFSASYTLSENANAINVGSTLSRWDGAGACLDFTGIPVTDAFYQKPDRKGLETDNSLDWESSYAVDWPRADRKGDVYLRTIFYTAPGTSMALKASQGMSAQFYTPDQSGSSVVLGGISGMERNNSVEDSGKIASIEDAFRMVENRQACITNTGSSSKIWWNPQAVYTASGSQRNISEEVNKLQAGSTCIG
ncbi:MAG TPA: carboxypeptidase-like regulatory domain-containing protein [archaeon]|nr:carboxypeptidase-like regulatory domain-containing protein [archaeon]